MQFRVRLGRVVPSVIVGVLLALAATSANAQAPVPGGPAVGEMAPDFVLPGATRYGLLREPVSLASLRGNTVVLAFFFKARTKGWTVQLEAYRDQYATLFDLGRKVTVLAVSVDPDTTLASWAREKDFPFLFMSDAEGKVGQRFGAYDAKNKVDNRTLFVIDPRGRVTYIARPFNVLSQDAYAELGREVAKASR